MDLKVSNNIIGVILISIIIAILSMFMIELYNDSESIDEFEELLRPIKAVLEENAKIELLTEGISTQKYFEIQFVLAPIILNQNKSNLDTLLVVQNLKENPARKLQIDTLYSSKNEHYRVILGIKKH